MIMAVLKPHEYVPPATKTPRKGQREDWCAYPGCGWYRHARVHDLTIERPEEEMRLYQ